MIIHEFADGSDRGRTLSSLMLYQFTKNQKEQTSRALLHRRGKGSVLGNVVGPALHHLPKDRCVSLNNYAQVKAAADTEQSTSKVEDLDLCCVANSNWVCKHCEMKKEERYPPCQKPTARNPQNP